MFHDQKVPNFGSLCNGTSRAQKQQCAANQFLLLNVDLSVDIEDKTLSWERVIHTCEEQTVKIFAEDLRVGVWLSNASSESSLTTCTLMRTRLVRWAGFRAGVMSCAWGLRASSGLSLSPMDIGAFVKGKKGVGKGKKGDGKASIDPRLRHVRSAARRVFLQVSA